MASGRARADEGRVVDADPARFSRLAPGSRRPLFLCGGEGERAVRGVVEREADGGRVEERVGGRGMGTMEGRCP